MLLAVLHHHHSGQLRLTGLDQLIGLGFRFPQLHKGRVPGFVGFPDEGLLFLGPLPGLGLQCRKERALASIQRRHRGTARRQTEMSQVVVGMRRVEFQRHLQGGSAGHPDGTLEAEDRRVIAVDRFAGPNSPPGLGVLVEGIPNREVSLLVRGLGRRHRQRLRFRFPGPLETEGDVGEDKIPAVGAGQPALGHVRMTQGIEPEPGDVSRLQRADQFILIGRRILSSGMHRSVRQNLQVLFQRRGTRRLHHPPISNGRLLQALRLPLCLQRQDLLGTLFHLLLAGGRLGTGLPEGDPLLLRARLQDGRSLRVAAPAFNRSLIEKGGELVILALFQRIELVVMTAAAVQGEPEPHRAHRLRHVHHVVHPVFLRDAPALAIDHVVPVEPCRQNLLRSGARQEISRQLPHRELVIGQIVVKSVHHPVAPRPHGALVVTLISVAVRVARRLQPIPGHALPVGRGGQSAVDETLPGTRSGVGEEGPELLRRRRQSGEVQRQAPDQRFTRSPGRRCETCLFQLALHQFIDGMPGGVFDGGPLNAFESPGSAPLGAFINPAAQGFNLRKRKSPAQLGGRHAIVPLLGDETAVELTGLRAPLLDHPVSLPETFHVLFFIQAQFTFATFLGIRTVALEAVVGEDRQHFPGKIDLLLGSR